MEIHIKKDCKNNNLSNLEWTTYKENTQYSIAKKVAKIDIATGEIIKIYKSIKDASKDIGLKNSADISMVCNGKRGRVSCYGFKWKHVE